MVIIVDRGNDTQVHKQANAGAARDALISTGRWAYVLPPVSAGAEPR
jgi:hypothetical protein